jgi:hypothetical protein
MVTSLIKVRLAMQTGVGVGAKGWVTVSVVVVGTKIAVGVENGVDNGVGEADPAQAVSSNNTQAMPKKYKQMDTERGRKRRVSISIL